MDLPLLPGGRSVSQSIYERLNVRVLGSMGPPLLFAHGFGSEQRVWRHQVAAFKERYQVILFDHVGCGRSDFNAYNAERYGGIHARLRQGLTALPQRRGLRGGLRAIPAQRALREHGDPFPYL